MSGKAVLSKEHLSLLGKGSPCSITSSRKLSSLWAGYGSIDEVSIDGLSVKDGACAPAPGAKAKLIVKTVAPPRGSSDDVSHQRKIRSYEVEASVYRHVAPALHARSLSVPLPLLVEGGEGGQLKLVMNDLREEFPVPGSSLKPSQVQAALQWLACMHATGWEQTPHEGLWEQGQYWHLRTRLEELESMSSQWTRLQRAAWAIDRRVRGLPQEGKAPGARAPRFWTTVHGDAKSANFLFSRDLQRCAGYDFQYCGGGFGATDVVMLLVSSAPRMDGSLEEGYLSCYLKALGEALGEGRADSLPSLEELRIMYEICLLDYVRFMAGWGFWGNDGYARTRALELLDRLDGCKAMPEEHYAQAVYATFPLP